MTRGRDPSPLPTARTAGLLYLLIIVCGMFAEVGVRGRLFVEGDAAATAERIAAAPGLFRAAFVADSLMVLADIALAVLLHVLLRPAGHTLSLVAMCFRLAQAGVLALNLLHYHAAMLLLGGGPYAQWFGPEQVGSLSYLFLDLHRHGYDLGLIPFGVHCVLLGILIRRSGYLPRRLGALAIAAGVTYLVGSFTRFVAPAALDKVAPIYVVALVSELALCIWLLGKGVNVAAWRRDREAA